MIVEEIRNIKSGKSELRKFGITIGIVLGLLGMWFLWREKAGSYSLLVSSIIFLSLAFICPLLLKPVQKMWMSLAVLLGWLMTRVILIILFYLVVTPTALLARLCGKDFLNTKFDRNAKSYWITRKAATPDKKSYENQF
jgi:TRAP-type uncharacterized transport system fused permease subunit